MSLAQRCWTAILLMFFVALESRSSDRQVELRPVDEAVRQPDFFTFRAHLQAAVAAHDAASVLAVVHPNIKNSFGGDERIESFQRIWKLTEPNSKLWRELGAVLALGGMFDGDRTFVAPYVFGRWPERLDAFEHAAIIGASVRVRATPQADAATLTVVSFAIVPLAPGSEQPAGEHPAWTAIKLPDGRTGYVAAQFIRSPIGYRAIFTRTGDRWQLTAFIAGD